MGNMNGGYVAKLDKDYIRFLVFLTIIILLTFPLMDIVSRSWGTGLMKSAAETVRTVDQSGISIFMSVIAGFYVSSVILLFFDRKKRVQAVILSIGIIAIAAYVSEFSTDWNIYLIGLGLIIGAFLGGVGSGDVGFKRAARNISYVSVAYVVLSYLNLYLPSRQFDGVFVKDSIVVPIFALLFAEVMSYKSKGPKIFIVGPGKSGKTLCLAGCYMRALKTAKRSLDPNKYLSMLNNQLNGGAIEGWPPQTGGIVEYNFTYEIGKLFPKDIVLESIDFPGPFIDKIPFYMKKIREGNKKIKGSEGEEDEDDEITDGYIKTTEGLLSSDKIIFIIDGSKFPNFGEMGILTYTEIINELHKKKKSAQCYIVITKSDMFANEYPSYGSDYDGFRSFITGKLGGNLNFRQLLNMTPNASIYPVLYYTRLNSRNELIPIRDAYGNVDTYGFTEFMDDLMV